MPPTLGEDLTRTSGGKSPDSTANPTTPTGAAGSLSELAKGSATSPNPASAMPPTAAPRPEQTKTEPTPNPSESQGPPPGGPAAKPEASQPMVPAPQPTPSSSELPKNAPKIGPETPKTEKSQGTPTPGSETPGSGPPQPIASPSTPGPSGPETTTQPEPFKLDVPSTTTEKEQPGKPAPGATAGIPAPRPESVASQRDPKRDEPGNPGPTQAIPKPDGPKAQSAPGIETASPGILKTENLTSSNPGMTTPAPGLENQPKAPAPESLGNTPKVEESSTPSRISTPAPLPISEPTGPKIQDVPPENESTRTRADEPSPEASRSSPGSPQKESATKWVRLPNRGKISDVIGGRIDAVSGAAGAAAGTSRDLLAHADKDLSFATDSSRDQPDSRRSSGTDRAKDRPPRRPSGTDTPLGSRLPNEPSSEVGSPQVEAVPHIVERGENFWTISRLYYNSARYYRALWKANVQKIPKIDGLQINDVIVIPPVEDLDPTYIEPPRVSNGCWWG